MTLTDSAVIILFAVMMGAEDMFSIITTSQKISIKRQTVFPIDAVYAVATNPATYKEIKKHNL